MPNQFRDLSNRVEDYKSDIEREVPETTDSELETTKRRVKTELRQQDSVASGDLIRSVYTVSSPIAARSSNRIYEGRLRVGAGHARFVEEGTGVYWTEGPFGPHKAPDGIPVIKIQQWIEDQGIIGDFYRHETRDGEIGSPLAWAIKHTIEELGNKRHPFLSPVWMRREPLVKASVRQKVSTLTKRM